MLDEVLEQLELAGRDVEHLPATPDFGFPEVHVHVGELVHLGLGGHGRYTPEEGLDPGE